MHLLASGYGTVEGPTVDDRGNLYFSDVSGGGVYELTPAGDVNVAVPKRRGVGGICLHRDGGIVVAGRDIAHVRDGDTRVIFGRDSYAATGLPPSTSFNDIHADENGQILAGAVLIAESGARLKSKLIVVSGAGEARIVYGDIDGTNGLARNWQSGRLYHCASFSQEIIVSEVSAGDTYRVIDRLSTAQIPGVPDGLALDEEGCLWVAFYGGGCVARISPAGEILEQLAVPASMVTSVCFGGPDVGDLVITTADNATDPSLCGCVFRANIGVAGAPVGRAKV
jgi:xylono-1,5-lactonase